MQQRVNHEEPKILLKSFELITICPALLTKAHVSLSVTFATPFQKK